MKQITAILLLLAFAAQTFSKGLLQVDYYINKASYEKACINKSNPLMHCCGRCQLKKKMQQEDNAEKQNPDRRADGKNDIPLSSKSFFAAIPVVLVTTEYSFHPLLSDNRELKMPRAFFHPPGALFSLSVG